MVQLSVNKNSICKINILSVYCFLHNAHIDIRGCLSNGMILLIKEHSAILTKEVVSL